MRLFYDVIANSSKLIYCPYQPGYKAMLNVTPSAWHMPSVMPESDFMFESKSYVKERTVLVLQSRWYGSFARASVDKVKVKGL